MMNFTANRIYPAAALLTLLVVGCGEKTVDAPPAAEPQENVTAQKATAGVGKQGQSLKDEPDIIAGPAKVLFKVRQQIVLDIHIPKALSMFKALEGRMPKDHDEFMEKIVAANRLTLPELPDGAEYRFEPEKGELWVYPVEE